MLRLRAIRYENGQFRESTISQVLPLSYNSFFRMGDMDGDGRSDLFYSANGFLHAAFGAASGFEPAGQPLAIGELPDPREEYQAAWLADLNGDERADFILGEADALTIHLSQGRNFASAKRVETPDVLRSFQSFADMDGDGRLEFARIADSRLHVTHFASDLSSAHTVSYSVLNPDSEHRWLVDWNGDGLADFLSHQDDKADH